MPPRHNEVVILQPALIGLTAKKGGIAVCAGPMLREDVCLCPIFFV